MAERYQKLFSLQGCYFCESCPVFIRDGAITKDNETGNVFLQLKMENVSGENKSINAVTVLFTLYDSYGKEIIKNFQYDYLDLDCKKGEAFGGKTPVFLPEQTIRSFTFTVKKVLFSDKSEWIDEGFEWESYPKQKSLDVTELNAQQIRQLKGETQGKAEFKYENFDKIWFCACGGINTAETEKCHACGLSKIYLENATPEYLQNNAVYDEAMANMSAKKYDEAIHLFGFIKGWRDADKKALECEEKVKQKKTKKKKKRIGCLISAISVIIAFVLLITIGIPALAYGIGNSNFKKGNHEVASMVFAFLSGMDYKDSSEKFVESSLLFIVDTTSNDYKLFGEQEYNSTIEYELASFFNGEMESMVSADVIKSVSYDWAVKQAEAGEYYFASHVFDCLDGYKDSVERMAQCNSEMIRNAQIGEYVRFGKFEQTSLFDGEEFIDWKVLDKKDNMILVVSDRALTRSLFSEDDSGESTWADSTIRRYLNSEFISEAFTIEEQNRLQTVSLSDEFVYDGEMHTAPITQDKVFLLSYNEVENYMLSDGAECIASNRVVENIYDESVIVTVSWALRSPEFVVSQDGVIKRTFDFYGSSMYIRPAMWISID